MASKPSERFEAAAAYLSNSSSLVEVPNDVKLELYALFKCITFSNKPSTPRPSLFDFTGRAKWDAWDRIGKQNKELPDLEERYVEIAQSLGWQDEIQNDWHHETQTTESDSESVRGGGGGGGGMGVAVSVVSQPHPDLEFEGTLHSFALSNDVSGLVSYLNAHPDIDVNSLDEYGYTPLHLAADRGNANAVQTLLDKGADVSIEDPDEFNALALAEVGGHDDIIVLLRQNAPH